MAYVIINNFFLCLIKRDRFQLQTVTRVLKSFPVHVLHSDVCCLLRYGSSTLRFVVVKIITLSGILAWCATPVIFNGVNRPWRLRWNAAGRCYNILDVISDLF